MSHTPGPWSFEWVYTLLRYSRKQVGPWDDIEGSHPNDDDASLIAAAPELLAAAHDVLAWADEQGIETENGEFHDLQAAVRKAMGAS